MFKLWYKLIVKDNKGSALVLAISLVTLLSILVLGYGVFVSTEFAMGKNDYAQWQSTYLAEAGVNSILADFRKNGQKNFDYIDHHYNTTLTITDIVYERPAGTVIIDLYEGERDWLITAQADYLGKKRVVSARIKNSDGKYIITNLKER